MESQRNARWDQCKKWVVGSAFYYVASPITPFVPGYFKMSAHKLLLPSVHTNLHYSVEVSQGTFCGFCEQKFKFSVSVS